MVADSTAVWQSPGNATARRAASPHDLATSSVSPERAPRHSSRHCLPACPSRITTPHNACAPTHTHRSDGRACRRRTRCSCTKRQSESMRGCCDSQKRSRALNTSCARRQAALNLFTTFSCAGTADTADTAPGLPATRQRRTVAMASLARSPAPGPRRISASAGARDAASHGERQPRGCQPRANPPRWPGQPTCAPRRAGSSRARCPGSPAARRA